MVITHQNKTWYLNYHHKINNYCWKIKLNIVSINIITLTKEICKKYEGVGTTLQTFHVSKLQVIANDLRTNTQKL